MAIHTGWCFVGMQALLAVIGKAFIASTAFLIVSVGRPACWCLFRKLLASIKLVNVNQLFNHLCYNNYCSWKVKCAYIAIYKVSVSCEMIRLEASNVLINTPLLDIHNGGKSVPGCPNNTLLKSLSIFAVSWFDSTCSMVKVL